MLPRVCITVSECSDPPGILPLVCLLPINIKIEPESDCGSDADEDSEINIKIEPESDCGSDADEDSENNITDQIHQDCGIQINRRKPVRKLVKKLYACYMQRAAVAEDQGNDFHKEQFPYGEHSMHISYMNIIRLRPVPLNLHRSQAKTYWLGSDFITAYLELVLAKKYGDDNLFYNPLQFVNLYTKLTKTMNKRDRNRFENNLCKWGPATSEKSIFMYRRLLFVVNSSLDTGTHWRVVLVDNNTERILWYDSLRWSPEDDYLDTIGIIRKYLCKIYDRYLDEDLDEDDELKIRLKKMKHPDKWKARNLSLYSPRQNEGLPDSECPMVNCGMFAIQNVRCIVQDGILTSKSYDDTLDGMNTLRQNTLYEIMLAQAYPSLYEEQ